MAYWRISLFSILKLFDFSFLRFAAIAIFCNSSNSSSLNPSFAKSSTSTLVDLFGFFFSRFWVRKKKKIEMTERKRKIYLNPRSKFKFFFFWLLLFRIGIWNVSLLWTGCGGGPWFLLFIRMININCGQRLRLGLID